MSTTSEAVSAEKGKTGAVFHLMSDTSRKMAARAVGGPDAAASRVPDHAIVPVVPNAAEMIAANPELAAKWLGISKETALSLVKPAAK